MRSGFTLIELSIVLVIIGLIAGGVFVGRDLIKAAEIRSVLKEKESFETAINVFRIKYGCLPGDCPNATQFWGEDTWPGSYGFKDTANGKLTANGNGNGKISAYFNSGSDYSWFESFTAWQHMSNADLIAGSFNGVYMPGAGQFIPGSNVPNSKSDPNNGWFVTHIEPMVDGSPLFSGSYGHTFILGKRGSNGDIDLQLGTLSPADQYALDLKTDDGKLGTGNLRGAPNGGYGFNCTDGNDPLTAQYQTTAKVGCTAYFITQVF